MERENQYWEVPYLPIDPSDLGREYEALVRINSQSGKGGVAFVLENHYGYKMPKIMHKEFGEIIQEVTEKVGEISPKVIMSKFAEEYLDISEPFKLIKFKVEDNDNQDNSDENTTINIKVLYNGEEKNFIDRGNGPINSLKNALVNSKLVQTTILDYAEHSLGEGSEAKAAAYVEMKRLDNSETTFGVGVDSNITVASIKAVFSAVNRLYRK